jgi:hypothetical protein
MKSRFNSIVGNIKESINKLNDIETIDITEWPEDKIVEKLKQIVNSEESITLTFVKSLNHNLINQKKK